MLHLRIALPLALAATILTALPGSAASAGLPSLTTAAVDGGIVSATVSGTIRTGVWRLTIRKPGVAERLRVSIERGDIAWGGAVIAQHKVGGRWVTTSRARLDDAGELPRTICASGMDACVPAGTVVAPHPGAQDLEAGFRLTGRGTWIVNGAVRQASEPFIYGGWIATGHDDLRF